LVTLQDDGERYFGAEEQSRRALGLETSDEDEGNPRDEGKAHVPDQLEKNMKGFPEGHCYGMAQNSSCVQRRSEGCHLSWGIGDGNSWKARA